MIRLVRSTVADQTTPPLFSDVGIGDALAMHGTRSGPNAVRLASADLLDQIAVSEVLLAKKITTQDLSTDGPAVSKELRAHAARLRAEAAADEAAVDPDIGFFHFIPGGEPSRFEGEEARLWRL